MSPSPPSVGEGGRDELATTLGRPRVEGSIGAVDLRLLFEVAEKVECVRVKALGAILRALGANLVMGIVTPCERVEHQ